jgi:hypothetical protein
LEIGGSNDYRAITTARASKAVAQVKREFTQCSRKQANYSVTKTHIVALKKTQLLELVFPPLN